ncbi:MAG TPA: TatD family hydrolase [Candidatus Desulfaltia sp.]|nr:TatD family hydrolase [Candidatus Desulfaltia sp.]
MYSESHCHLRAITPEAVEKAEADGFKLLLSAGIDLKSSEEAAETAKKFGIVKGCVGVHPWYADEYSRDVEARFRELAGNPEVVAISEIGLDFVGRMTKEWVREERYIDNKTQYRTLKDQLGLAHELKLPAIVHDRAPGQEILNTLLKSDNLSTGLAIHGFGKDAEYAKRCVDHGVYLSIGLRTIQGADENYRNAVKAVPLEYILTETDSGTPQGVLTVCDLVAEIKGHTRLDVGEAATRNLTKLCGL